jgi:hypothetical protein
VHTAAAGVCSALRKTHVRRSFFAHKIPSLGVKEVETPIYPVIRIRSKVPNHLLVIVESGFGLDFEATHDLCTGRQVYFNEILLAVECEYEEVINMLDSFHKIASRERVGEV